VFGRWLAWIGAVAAPIVIVATALLWGVFAIPAILGNTSHARTETLSM
jgi:hypothetical protein